MSMISVNEVEVTKDTKEIFRNRVIPIVEHYLTTDDLFTNLDQNEMVEVMVDAFMKHFSNDELEEMTDETLTLKIRKVLGLEALSHLFDDLTPEQIAEYEEVVQSMRKSW